MKPGNSLHFTTVSYTQTISVNAFHLSDIRLPKLCDGNFCIATDDARHAGIPEQLLVELPSRKSV